MKKVLFMHGGSGNHGCEAIVRTTSKLLGDPQKLILWSQCKSEDEKYGIDSCVGEIVQSEEIKKYSFSHIEALLRRKLLGDQSANLKVFLRESFRDRIAISIGGDNYCYPWSASQAVELDKEIRKWAAKTVLWGCSVSKDALTPAIREDISKFDLITARESITYDLLRRINVNTIKVADPAFLLERIDLPLPDGFVEGNTVGINISPMVNDYAYSADVVLQSYKELIRYIIQQTDMNICLIPHVVWKQNNDLDSSNILLNEFYDTGRIMKVDDCNCMQLKGYIARCRFFVGARTHATIAAYSSSVPTLTVGYSVKSLGIARDIFGTDERYVLSVQNMKTGNELKNHFQWLKENEKTQRAFLENRMEDYRKEAELAGSILKEMM